MNSDLADHLPTRSRAGKASLDIFYTDFNDVSFYVEDENQENLYCEVLRKLLKNIRIERIFPLGGKNAVLDHASSLENDGLCFRAYIVDRDFDHLLSKQSGHPNVFYLAGYCIENHLLESGAIVEVVIENNPRKKRTDVEAVLSIQENLNTLYKELRPLFTLFFVYSIPGLTGKELFVTA